MPLNPVWQEEIVEASTKGPIAVAVNGVPIFHYEARPDVATYPEHNAFTGSGTSSIFYRQSPTQEGCYDF